MIGILARIRIKPAKSSRVNGTCRNSTEIIIEATGSTEDKILPVMLPTIVTPA